jgi:hypothetical protein
MQGKINSDMPYACQNTERKDFYYGLSREYYPDGKFSIQLAKIPNDSSPLCRYDARATDTRCNGCKKPSDIEYLRDSGYMT